MYIYHYELDLISQKNTLSGLALLLRILKFKTKGTTPLTIPH
jgi:hypothetical protein